MANEARFEIIRDDEIEQAAMKVKEREILNEIEAGTLKWMLAIGWITEKLPSTTKNITINIGDIDQEIPISLENLKAVNSLLEESLNSTCFYMYNEGDGLAWIAPITKEEVEFFERVKAGDKKAAEELYANLVYKQRQLKTIS